MILKEFALKAEPTSKISKETSRLRAVQLHLKRKRKRLQTAPKKGAGSWESPQQNAFDKTVLNSGLLFVAGKQSVS